MADEKRGITVKIDAALHAEVKQFIESQGITMAEFVSQALYNELHPKIQPKEVENMEKMRTVAVTVPEELFQKIKVYLNRHHMTQKEFIRGLIASEIERDQELVDKQNADISDNTNDESEDEDFGEDMDSDELYDEESEDENFDEDMDSDELDDDEESEDKDFAEDDDEYEELDDDEELDDEESEDEDFTEDDEESEDENQEDGESIDNDDSNYDDEEADEEETESEEFEMAM